MKNDKYKFFIFLLISILLTSCQHKQEEIRILLTGDILLSRQVKKELNHRNESPWEDLKSLFHNADLVIGNLEGAVGTTSETLDSNGSPLFAIDSADISLLADAGFKIIGIENNHSYDLGNEGKQNTVNQLLKNNIHSVCFENSPYFITVKGVTISIVTINTVPRKNNFKNPIYSLELKQKLRLAKSMSNMVIVSIHWGNELLEWSNKSQREAAKWLIEQGADAIIGSHPHVVQNVEKIDGKPVFFSLGNHLFDQKYPATKKGLIVEITIKNGKIQCKGITTRTKSNSFYPEMAESVSYNFPAVAYNRNLLSINDYSLVPVSIFEQNKTKIILEAYRNNRLQWRSHSMLLIYITTAKLDGKEEYLFALQNYYSTLDKEIAIRPYVYGVDNQGLYAKWRGSALAFPLLDASISPHNPQILCAVHRGDSYISLNKENIDVRIIAYEWNGFGFSGLPDSVACKYCKKNN
jgi:poly-gamma-glutamate synthesis protein (capsule biosynthesis protein)